MVTVHTLIDEKERFLNELRHNKNRFRDFLGSMAAHYRQPISSTASHRISCSFLCLLY